MAGQKHSDGAPRTLAASVMEGPGPHTKDVRAQERGGSQQGYGAWICQTPRSWGASSSQGRGSARPTLGFQPGEPLGRAPCWAGCLITQLEAVVLSC